MSRVLSKASVMDSSATHYVCLVDHYLRGLFPMTRSEPGTAPTAFSVPGHFPYCCVWSLLASMQRTHYAGFLVRVD